MQVYVIRRAFLVPLGVMLSLCLALSVIVVIQHQPLVKLLVLGCVLLPLGGIFTLCLFRRVELDGEAIRSIRFGRATTFRWSEVTALEAVRMRQRAFLTVCAGEEFIILSNMYRDFAGLTAEILARVPASAVGEEARKVAEAPPVKQSDIVILWGLAALMAYLIYAQF